MDRALPVPQAGGAAPARSAAASYHRTMDSAWVRRPVMVTAVLLGALLLTVSIPIWLVVATLADLVLGRPRLPTTRLLAFGTAWCWLEMAGVAGAIATWSVGRARDMPAQYALQRWWAARIIGSLRLTCGLRIEVDGVDEVPPGPIVCLVRHASLGDALVSAWILGSLVHRHPRYVMKRELLLDPCLDIVGQRIPNWFLDRGSAAVRQELAGIRSMAEGMGERDVAVIFPEGTRASDDKRAYLVDRLERRDPERHARMVALRHLLPPRAAGARTLLAAVPDASVVFMWHTGFDGLDSISGIHRAVAQGRTRARVVLLPVPRSEVPDDERFDRWLDDHWVAMDGRVAEATIV